MKKLALVTLLALVLSGGSAFADAAEERQAARSFQLRHRDASRAAAVIKPLITSTGSVSIQPSSNTLVVTDAPSALAEIERALDEFDAPAKQFEVAIRLVSASRVSNPPPVPPALRDISTKLSGVLRFNRFDSLGEIEAGGREGDPLRVGLSEAYRAEFKLGEFDPVTQSLQLTDFRLLRLTQGSGDLQPVFRNATLNLKVGQTVVLGVSKSPEDARVLMLVLLARPGE